MLKKFKNPLLIKGEHHQLLACKVELEKLGMKESDWSDYKNKGVYYIGTNIAGDSNLFTNFVLDVHAPNETLHNSKRINLNLPEDWIRFRELASELEEEKPKFDVGDYLNYSLGNYNAIYKIIEFKGDKVICENTGSFCTIEDLHSGIGVRKATPQEIEAHLIKLAEEKGFKVGSLVTTGADRYDKITAFELYDKANTKHQSNYVIQYAEKEKYFLVVKRGEHNSAPLDLCKLKPSAPEIPLAGYKGEFTEDGVKFGCAFINRYDLNRWYKELSKIDGNIIAKSTDIKIEGIKISKDSHSDILTLDQIKQITDYFNKK